MNRDELIENVVGAFGGLLKGCYCTLDSDTCADCEDAASAVLDAVLPLIEADVRERIATEIEATGRKEVEWLADTRTDAIDMGRLIGTENGYKDAIRIVRRGRP